MAAVCVFCSSSERIPAEHVQLAHQVGAEIARRGHRLVSGGGRLSMMGAVARAARAGGAHTTGVIPQALTGLEVADTDADELVVTADMRARKGLMDSSSDAFLALPGGLGTLEELLEVWVAATLGMHDKPVVVVDPGGTFDPLHTLVQSLVRDGFVRAGAADAVRWVRTPQQALDEVEAALARRAALPAATAPAAAAAAAAGAALAEELLEAEP
jgi:uncharacterized protein (TIGR00730 family)